MLSKTLQQDLGEHHPQGFQYNKFEASPATFCPRIYAVEMVQTHGQGVHSTWLLGSDEDGRQPTRGLDEHY